MTERVAASSTLSLPAAAGRRRRREFLTLLVLSSVILSLCMGLRQSLGIFLSPVTVDLGISASAFSFAIALQNIVWGASQPVVGLLGDRFGARPVVLATALIYAAGMWLMAASGGTIGLNVAGALIGVGVAGCGFGVLVGVVSRAAPPERRSQAVGTVAAAGSIATMVLAPLGQSLIAEFGWRIALLVFTGIAASMAVLALALAREGEGAAAGVAADTDDRPLRLVLRQALRHPGYLAMTVAFFACGFQLLFITTHLPSYLQLCGLPPSVGASALGVIGICNAIGTYGIGHLGARFSQKRLLALAYLLRTVAIVVYVMLPASTVTTMIFAAAMGLLWLSVVPLVSGILGKLFGMKHFGTLYGIVFFSHQVGSFCGAILGGLVYDLTGGYGLGWSGLIAIGLIAFLLQWQMDERPPERIRAGEPAMA
jgi:predicted MFS family arabinose efflux permease